MDTHSTIDRTSLRQGLMQMLRCYAASGVQRFSVQPSSGCDLELLSQLVASTSAAPAPVSSPPTVVRPTAEASATVARAPVAVPESPPPASSSAPLPVSTKPVSPTPAVAELLPAGSWQLPNMDDATRISKLEELDSQVKACRKCPELVCYRRQTVFGEGNHRPRICFFGEAPGADEDAQGRPFVGAAGRLLTDIIRAMKLTREEVYILNSLKCRPPQNRTPLPEEVDNCRPFALTQLEILQPDFIILLGAVAVRSVLQSTDPVGRLRGRFHQFHGARVLVTYHPAYLLRNPDAKKLVWQDVQMVMRELGTA